MTRSMQVYLRWRTLRLLTIVLEPSSPGLAIFGRLRWIEHQRGCSSPGQTRTKPLTYRSDGGIMSLDHPAPVRTRDRSVVLLRPQRVFGPDRGTTAPIHWGADTTQSARALDSGLAGKGLQQLGTDGVRMMALPLVGLSRKFDGPSDWSSYPSLVEPEWGIQAPWILWTNGLKASGIEGSHRTSFDRTAANGLPTGDHKAAMAWLCDSDLVVFDCSKEELYGLGAIIARTGVLHALRRGGTGVAWFDGQTLTEDGLEWLDREAAYDPKRAFAERFDFSWRVNMAVIGSRALLECIRLHPDPEREPYPHVTLAIQGALWSGGLGGWMLPQVLFEVARQSPILLPVPHGESPDHVKAEARLFHCVDNDGQRVVWKGTGKYEPRVVLGEKGVRVLVGDVISAAAGFRLLTSDGTGLAVTTRGRAWLDYMAPFDDPDMPLRWSSSVDPAAVKAADRWLMRGFRALKRATSALPARN